MKKYTNLGELFVDYRANRKISQLDFAALLDVDVRSVIRWEKNESLLKVDKEKLLIEKFGIPHQVIRNLNTDTPIAIYFDFERWRYSLSFLSMLVTSSWEFNRHLEVETDRIQVLTESKDFEFISFIQQNQNNVQPIRIEVLKKAAKILPELNLVLYGQSGYHGGHVSVLPLKHDTFLALKEKRKRESEINEKDINTDFDSRPLVFYYYSIYANSLDNTYYLVNKLLNFFKSKKFDDYWFAGIAYQKNKVDRFNEIGVKTIWEEQINTEKNTTATFVAGNLNSFLFSQ